VKCFALVRKLEEKSLQTCETNGRNDARTNASESGFVLRSCSYANVGFFGYEGRCGRREPADRYEDKASRASGRASQEWGSRDPEEPTPTRECQP
jgi:hypothetical protein